jgi:hypothetical protein
MGVIRRLTDRGTEYRGKPETHDDPLDPALNDIEAHPDPGATSTNERLCERCHETLLQAFCQVAFHRRLYLTLENDRPISMLG